MLKIKNNIDLKELEKYEFKDEKFSYIYKVEQIIHIYRSGKKMKIKKFSQKDEININKKTREITINYNVKDNGEMYGCSGCVDKLDVFYDLFKAGLVEKVSD